MTNEEIVREACRVIWSEGDLSRVAEFYAEDFVPHASPAGPIWGPGLDGLREMAGMLRAAFPDYNETIEDLIVQDDKVVARLTVRGTQTGDLPFLPATGKSVEITDISICRIAGGKIAEQWAVTDNLAMLEQLGLLEPPREEQAASS